jgi:hypothetical protein
MALPLFIQRRMYSFKEYVYNALYPDDTKRKMFTNKTNEEKKQIISKMNDIVDECSYACFVFSLKQFFQEGTRSAKEAVSTFKELGVSEFYIGKKVFSENNTNVLEGENLYQIMINSINNQTLKTIIEESQYHSQIVDKYKNAIPI